MKAMRPACLAFVLIALCSAYGADPRGIAELLRALDDKDTRFEALGELKDLGLDAAPAVPQLMRLLDVRDHDTRLAAVNVLEAIGKDAAAAIPKLVERLDEGELPRISTELPATDVGVHAAFALGEIGKDAVPFLTACLANKRSAVRSNAACALAMMGSDAQGAATALIGRLTDRDWLVRQCAAEALGSIRAEPHRVIPALVGSLKDENLNVRRFAAAALGAIRPTTPDGVEGLILALHDQDGNVQHEAAHALGKLGADAVTGVPSLARMLKSRQMFVEGHPGVFQPVAETAAWALGVIGPRANIAIPAILDVVRDSKGTFDVPGIPEDNHRVRAAAAVAAAQIDSQYDGLVPVLSRSLEQDDRIADKVAVALALIGPKAKIALPALDRLAQSDCWCALHCASAVVVIDSDYSSAVTTLLRRMPPKPGPFDDDAWSLLRTALAKGGDRSRPAIPILIELVRDVSADRRNAARTLAVFGPGAQSAVPSLLALLSDRGGEPRQAAVESLQEIASEKSAPLLDSLRSPNPVVRSGVLEVLGRFPGALALITDAIDDPSARVRLAALLALAKLERSARSAIPKIRGLLQADSRTIRDAAIFALQAIERNETRH